MSKTNKPTVGCLGGGFVGDIITKYYKDNEYDVKVYDIAKELDPLEEVLKQEVIFIAFNLKDNCRSQESYEAVATYARKAPEKRIFIIKSTFIPNTTDKLQAEFPQHIFVYSPEFLTEATAWHDFTKPHIQIFGCPHASLKIVHDILIPLLPPAPVTKIISPRDAEVVKHATNSFYATKVVYFNQLHDACEELEADYETIKDILVLDRRIGDSHSIIEHNGYRGFGDTTLSKCLPKDIDAFANVCSSELLDKVIEINKGYLEEYYKNKKSL